jgi:thiol-disulfide isomerase/thioredoxin
MKTTLMKFMAIAVTLTAGTLSLMAASLNIGDPAPKLEVSKWVQGDAVTEFKPGTVYIVEFWATWCGPCKASIPHLNELYLKIKDKGVVVIGQDAWERDIAKVEPFVKEMGEKMTYRVALDTIPEGKEASDGKMVENWMKASGSSGIPTAFVVNKEGKIAWIGHPMTLKESVIEEIAEGKFDIQKAAQEHKKEVEKEEAISKNYRALGEAMKAKDWDKASQAVDGLEAVLDGPNKASLASFRVRILVDKGDTAGAVKAAAKAGEENKDNVQLNNELARILADIDGIKGDDLEVAATLASRANDSSKGEKYFILDTMAKIAFLQGNKDKAVEWETKALEKAPEQIKKSYEKRVAAFKEGTLPK